MRLTPRLRRWKMLTVVLLAGALAQGVVAVAGASLVHQGFSRQSQHLVFTPATISSWGFRSEYAGVVTGYHFMIDHGRMAGAEQWTTDKDGVRTRIEMEPLRFEDMPAPLRIDLVSEPLGGASIGAIASGWPMRSFGCVTIMKYATGAKRQAVGGVMLEQIAPSLTAMPSKRRANAIPLTPIWRGFAVNTLLFAALVYAIFVAPFDLRRSRRQRTGRCTACGYPLTNPADPCPECGAANA